MSNKNLLLPNLHHLKTLYHLKKIGNLIPDAMD